MGTSLVFLFPTPCALLPKRTELAIPLISYIECLTNLHVIKVPEKHPEKLHFIDTKVTATHRWFNVLLKGIHYTIPSLNYIT